MRWVVLVVLAGCYEPAARDCAYRCGGMRCPSGLTCDDEGFCRTGTSGGSCALITGDDGGGSCWPYATSNVDPCAAGFPASIGPLDVTSDLTLDTNAPHIGMVSDQLVILHVDRLGVPASKRLLITGGRALIIVSEADAVIDGIIEVRANVVAASAPCTAGNGQDGLMSFGAGGGGGGYGQNGANGGMASGNESLGGPANGDAMLVPLRGGCNGGAGGNSGQPSGSGGAGGGALQISARTAVRVGGEITANGDGGTGGGSAVCMSSPCSSGGGGGGSGGAVLLEGMTVDVLASGFVCAVGGAGGNGGGGGTGNDGTPGAGGNRCAGGTASVGGIAGGKGGDVSPATDGTDTMVSGASSGGGGGSVGRIRLRAITTTPTINGITVP